TGGSSGANAAPIVQNDTLSNWPNNQVLTIHPLANDSDPDGDQLQIISVGTSPFGSVVNNGSGSITFVPNASFCGPVRIPYTVSDGNGNVAHGYIGFQTVLPDGVTEHVVSK
ncbi:MAG: Unknown protein, partial [uncultured Thiotrichaceae bacterium]